MKKTTILLSATFLILFISPVLLPIKIFSQDSSKVEVSGIAIKGKDVSFFYLYLQKNSKNESLDSSIKIKFRPTYPGDNTDITFNSIQRRVWRDIVTILSANTVAIHPANDVYKRVRNAIQLINDPWLNDKIIKLEAELISQATVIQETGKKAARRIED